MLTDKEFIELILSNTKDNQTDIAEKIGCQKSFVSQIKNGTAKLPKTKREILEKLYQNLLMNIDDSCFNIVVRSDVSASMGYGVTIYNESQTGTYQISKKLASDLGIIPDKTEMIFASGDSMLPTIEGGDSLLVDLNRKEIYDGRIYCVRIDGQLYAKRLQKIPPSKVIVISDNQKYQSFEIDFSKQIDFDFEVIGEVRWWGRVAR